MKLITFLIVVNFLVQVSCGENSPTGPEGAGDFLIKNGNLTIAGTMDLPLISGPYPVVIIVPGSGTETREAGRPVLDILLPQGIAVFRYDKRGLGQSTGTFEEVSVENSIRVLQDRASDVIAIVDFLITHKDINPNQIFVLGSSQGGWVAPLVATQSENVAYIICASGGGSPLGIENYYDSLADDASLSIEQLNFMLENYSGPLGYDPRSTLEGLSVPALWIYGGMDRSNPTFYDIDILEKIKQERNKDFTISLFPFSNHDLIDVRTGEFDPELFSKMIEWVNEQLNRN